MTLPHSRDCDSSCVVRGGWYPGCLEEESRPTRGPLAGAELWTSRLLTWMQYNRSTIFLCLGNLVPRARCCMCHDGFMIHFGYIDTATQVPQEARRHCSVAFVSAYIRRICLKTGPG